MAAHRTLLANASHELRSPLARLGLAIDLDNGSTRPAARAEIARSVAELEGLVEEAPVILRGEERPLRPMVRDLMRNAACDGRPPIEAGSGPRARAVPG